MILLVDDCPRRHAAFDRAFGGHAGAQDFASAIIAMSESRWLIAAIYLDHDGVDGDLLAEWMAQLRPHPYAKIVIHSSNYVGSIKMRDTLRAAGYDVEMKAFAEVVADEALM
ncbi:MAG: cyclic-phosphate processing receiver domain-containing protein [Planctomycetota bacterium]